EVHPSWFDPVIQRIEGVCRLRSSREWYKQASSKPLLLSFSTPHAKYEFALPRRADRSLRPDADRAGGLVWSVLSRPRPIDRRLVAAVVWKAGKYLVEPSALAGRRITLEVVADHFGLTKRQVFYASKKLVSAATKAQPH